MKTVVHNKSSQLIKGGVSGHSEGMNLSLVGMRMGPIDPTTHTAKIGVKQEVVKPEYGLSSFQQRVLKERSGFSGGFKIPEEQRKKKMGRLGKKDNQHLEEEFEGTQQNQITKDEIFQQLNLGQSEAGIGVGRHGTNSKAALGKDLVEGIEKDLEKLRRQQENISLRKTLAQKGVSSLEEETDEDKLNQQKYQMKGQLEQEGAFVITASPKKIQAMRHQASQLQSHANMSLEELEAMRKENEEKLKRLSEMYNKKRVNQGVGKAIRQNMGLSQQSSSENTPRITDQDLDNQKKNQIAELNNNKTNDNLTFGSPAQDNQFAKSGKKKKSVRIAEEGDNQVHAFAEKQQQYNIKQDNLAKPSSQIRQSKQFTPARSRSASVNNKQIIYDSPRRKLYEAKFEKYAANKENKKKIEKKLETMAKEDFDRFTKDKESPSKQTQRYKVTDEKNCPFNRYDAEQLIPKTYEQELLQKQEEEMKLSFQQAKEDQFRELGVTNEDKMTFFLLKWVFNAIKRDSAADDPKLKGNPYVTKIDLVKQLSKNDELMKALGFQDTREISNNIKLVHTIKDGCLQWEEFLDFVFLRNQSSQKNDFGENWWRRIGKPKEIPIENTDNIQKTNTNQPKAVPKYGQISYGRKQEEPNTAIPKYDDPDRKSFKITENLKMLQDTRSKKIEEEVEDEFRILQEKKIFDAKVNSKGQTISPIKKQSQHKVGVVFDEYGDDFLQEEGYGIKKEKSQCLLLNSQVQIMKDIFDSMDKYKDQILRRGEYVMQLRTDERVVGFIDVDSVKLAYSKKTLTLDEIFSEIEKDEVFELAQMGKNTNQINHKEFITWKEFMSYFNDYKEIEDRNQMTKQIQKTRQAVNKTNEEGLDTSVEIGSLMEQEKQRRLKEIPKLRPADQIDITEKQLQLLKDIYSSLPKVQAQKEMVHTIEFFIALRKNPQLRTLSSTIARDPEGTSRIPRETFQQVFDRMEKEIQQKQIDWALIVEYFTKRGRPLSKDEIQKLIDEDRKQREEEESKKRGEEEAERRRMARLMEDLEEKEDFEMFEKRQQNEIKYGDKSKKKNQRQDSDDENKQNFVNDDSQEDDEQELERDEGYVSDPEIGTAQRTYNFGNNNQGRNLSRPKSAKTFDERNLKNVQLTNKDYIQNERERGNILKLGKYGITVPKPFKFDLRESKKEKGIRQQKLEEMIAEKQLVEENIIKHQFRHNPIPPVILIPRYQAIQDANERRRLQVKQNSIAITKQNEKPFSFYIRDKSKKKLDPEEYLTADLKKGNFKANPIPRACSVIIFDQMMKKQQMEREERVRRNAELNYQKAKLPERMQMHEEKKKQMPPKINEEQYHSFKPRINELVTREEFIKKQESFMKQLTKKKSQKTQTRPLSPNFTKKKTKQLDREFMNEGTTIRSGSADKLKIAMMKSMAKTIEEKVAVNPSSTKGTNLAMQKRREELEAKRKKEELKLKEDKDRFEKQNRLKTVVQAALQDRIKDETAKRREEMEESKKAKRNEEKKTREMLKQRVESGRSRPLLIESSYGKKTYGNLEKTKATMMFNDILKKNDVNPNNFLDDEQKDIIEDQRFIEKKKKEYGRF